VPKLRAGGVWPIRAVISVSYEEEAGLAGDRIRLKMACFRSEWGAFSRCPGSWRRGDNARKCL